MKVIIWMLYIMIYNTKGTMQICQLLHNGITQQDYDVDDICLIEPPCAIWCNDWDIDSLFKLLLPALNYGTEAVYSNLTISNPDIAVWPDIFHDEEVSDDDGNIYSINVIALILDDTGLQKISVGAFSFFTKSSEVHLSKNHLTSITTGVFDPLTDLVLLDLSYNELSFIDDSAFEHNKKLSFLYLNDNKLISVPQTQMSLIVLDMSNNSPQDFDTWSLKREGHIETLNLSRLNINESMVDFTPNLELRQLILNHNKFTALDEDIFCNTSQIFKLDLCYNKIDSLKEDFFRNLINLEFLHLRNNKLSKIDAHVFAQNNRIITLDLSENMIVTIEPAAFKSLINLEFLHLRNNKLSKIDADVLALNNKLITLDLSENMIVTIMPSAFESLINLEFLHLRNNKLSKIDADVLALNNKLITLDLSENMIVTIMPSAFESLINLEFLHLRKNKLSKIDGGVFAQNHKLITLDLSENMIVTVEPSAFENLSKLEVLNMNNNCMKNLPDILYNQKGLKQLTLIDNPFEVLPLYETWNFPQLRDLNLTGLRLDFQATHFSLLSEIFGSIDLSNNTVSRIDSKMFANLSLLVLLDMSYNLLFSIDKQAFRDLSCLKTLKLQGNNLKSISSHLFNNNQQLKHLNLSHNNFSNISAGVFDSCRDLTILDLSFNKITKITKFNFHQQINLEMLYLNNNNLSTVEEIYYLRNLRSISIENNNWDCHYLFNFLQQLDFYRISVVYTDISHYPKEHLRQIACHQNGTNTSENIEEHIYIKSNDNFRTLRKYMLRMFEEISDNLKNISRLLEKSEHTSHLDQFAEPSNEGVKATSNLTFSLDLKKEKEVRSDIELFLYVLIVFGLCILSVSILNLYYKIKKVRLNGSIL